MTQDDLISVILILLDEISINVSQREMVRSKVITFY